jgi:hypothetical protein
VTRLFSEPIPIRLSWCEGEVEALRVGAARLPIVEVVRRWRVDLEWWRDGASRDYLTVRTADGSLLDLFGDRRSGEWFIQRLAD